MIKKTFDFIVHGGQVTVEGKPQWPDLLTLRMTHQQALALIRALASQLESGEDDGEVTVVNVGILIEDTEA